ncbi:MAG: endonuclease domain-containing protein [Candidatus Peribacteraceae bacterium]|nr:endonuclease domain-containing protein [Candidatus Peribacteraceae bacterium]
MVFQTGPSKRRPVTVERARILRKGQTVMEMLLWRELRDRRLNGLKFRRQVPIGPFIVDFYCAEKKLIVELDGSAHEDLERKMKDQERERYLSECGYQFLRFTNDETAFNIMSVLDRISATCGFPVKRAF